MINDKTAILAAQIKAWGKELGFADVQITDLDLSKYEQGLQSWLDNGYHGTMDYMAKHGMLRARPSELVPNALRAIVVRMDYLPQNNPTTWRNIELKRELTHTDNPQQAVISIYARGRDYHKVVRSKLQQLAAKIEAQIGAFGYRAFTDSAPILEVALAEKAGLGWRGKHTLLLNRHAGSTFFLGEIIIDLPLPIDAKNPLKSHPTQNQCGSCTACINACPTQAIIAPYQLDARRCISYLTIELKGAIPLELRRLIGNRIYGCDDCQLVCPWNKFAKVSTMPDFDVRNGLDNPQLITLFNWTEIDFNKKLEGSPIRRIGYESWLRNIAVALGNARNEMQRRQLNTTSIDAALSQKLDHSSDIVREHVRWALGLD